MWVSKLQTYIAISALNYEYVTLSNSVREFITFKSLINEVIYYLGVDSKKLKFVSRFTVYGDNNGAIFVATSPRMTTASNQIAVKYHWFSKHTRKGFVIWKIESENQKTDIFIKDLQGELFVSIRNFR